MARRKYSDRERAEILALHDSGITLTELSRQTGIPDSTLSQWINGRNGLNADTPRLRNLSKKTLADKFENIAEAYIEQSLKKQSVIKTSGYYAVKAANEAVGSMRLLRDQATSITHSENAANARESYISALRDLTPENEPFDEIQAGIKADAFLARTRLGKTAKQAEKSDNELPVSQTEGVN